MMRTIWGSDGGAKVYYVILFPPVLDLRWDIDIESSIVVSCQSNTISDTFELYRMPQNLVSPDEVGASLPSHGLKLTMAAQFLTKLGQCFSDPSSSSSVWLTHKRCTSSRPEITIC